MSLKRNAIEMPRSFISMNLGLKPVCGKRFAVSHSHVEEFAFRLIGDRSPSQLFAPRVGQPQTLWVTELLGEKESCRASAHRIGWVSSFTAGCAPDHS